MPENADSTPQIHTRLAYLKTISERILFSENNANILLLFVDNKEREIMTPLPTGIPASPKRLQGRWPALHCHQHYGGRLRVLYCQTIDVTGQ